ncbi:MAG: cell division protein FtsX [Alistipes onderdonkii]
MLFGATLLFISLILLNNTIRVTVYSKRYIIQTMKLVGATRWFIMRPFLAGSVLQGIYAGLIAWGMLSVMIVGLNEDCRSAFRDRADVYPRHLRGADGRRGVHFARVYRVRRAQIPEDAHPQGFPLLMRRAAAAAGR